MAETVGVGTTRRSVVVSFAVNCVEVIGLAVAAWITHSVALGAQTATNAADVAVGVFLLIGVVSSSRPPDETHPLGYIVVAISLGLAGRTRAPARLRRQVPQLRSSGSEPHSS